MGVFFYAECVQKVQEVEMKLFNYRIVSVGVSVCTISSAKSTECNVTSVGNICCRYRHLPRFAWWYLARRLGLEFNQKGLGACDLVRLPVGVYNKISYMAATKSFHGNKSYAQLFKFSQLFACIYISRSISFRTPQETNDWGATLGEFPIKHSHVVPCTRSRGILQHHINFFPPLFRHPF